MNITFEKIKSILFYFSLVMILFANKNIIYSELEEQESKESIGLRTALISWANQTWSGVILQKDKKFSILTIVHEETWRKTSNKKGDKITVFTEDQTEHLATISYWEPCSEIAILDIDEPNTDSSTFQILKISEEEENLADKVYSFGHPLGLNLHYSEGVVTSKENILKPCGMITNGFSGGTIPGQTGSGVWNEHGELIGLIVAASAYSADVYSPSYEKIGFSKIPITFLGRYVRATEIESVIEQEY